MNIFFRELKSYRKGLFFWSIGIIAMLGASMAKFAAIQGNGQAVNDLMARLPNSVQAIFGLSGFDISQASGYYGVLFIYIALMVTVHAVLLGTDIISKEERDKTSEFLFVKPIPRARVVTGKLLAGLLNIALLNIVTLFASLYFVDYFSKTGSITSDIALLMVGLFFLQLLFFFIGTTVAAISKSPKRSAPIATAVLLFTFIISFLININDSLENMKYLTPFKYFDAKTIIENSALDPLFVTVSLILVGIMITTTYLTYKRRDFSI